MITDRQTNFLYLADTLPKNYSDFYNRFESVLKDCNIAFDFLPQTKDVWAVDYMPIQTDLNRFVRFAYNPSYLQTKKYLKSISDVDEICKAIGIETFKTNIIIDGGNVGTVFLMREPGAQRHIGIDVLMAIGIGYFWPSNLSRVSAAKA